MTAIFLIPNTFAQEPPGSPEYFLTHVKPIFQENCYRCHGGINRQGRLNVETKAGMLRGGRDGAVIVPGDPARSLLLTLIRHEGPRQKPMPMPPKSKISDADIATVTLWIKAGAVMPDDPPKHSKPPSVPGLVFDHLVANVWLACGPLCG